MTTFSGSDPWLAGAREPLLEVRGLSKAYELRRGPFGAPRGRVRAAEGVSLHVEPGETLALVGESGSGKTTVARALVRLVEPDAGVALWRTRTGVRVDLFAASPGDLRALRREIGIVFQDPFASLNPRLRVAATLTEPLAVHRVVPQARHEGRVQALLESVGLRPEIAARFPHQLSGGERQRVAVARALALEPRLLVCDEAVSALDLSVQAQLLELFDGLQRALGLSLLFVAHDLAVVRHVADRVAVMYLGALVELGTSSEVFQSPAHPYTRALLDSIPAADPQGRGRIAQRVGVRGEPPRSAARPSGCPFHPRCPLAEARCRELVPPPVRLSASHVAACHLVAADSQSDRS